MREKTGKSVTNEALVTKFQEGRLSSAIRKTYEIHVSLPLIWQMERFGDFSKELFSVEPNAVG